MSAITSVSPAGNDFRTASGLSRWPATVADLVVADPPASSRGPGLFGVIRAGGTRAITNVRRLAGAERTPGSALVTSAAILLGLLAVGLFVVSLAAQYRYVWAVKHESVPSAIEAVGLDAGMTVFSLLALGLAMAGQSARIERVLIVVCAVASAGQNYAAADVSSPRSVAAYVVPPLFLALVVDRVVAVVRRHVLGAAERSVWGTVGRALVAMVKGSAVVLLYLLRLILAPRSTTAGLRRWVLVLTPLPAAASLEKAEGSDRADAEADDELAEPEELAGASKKARLTWWYERDADYGIRAAVAAAAKRLAPKVDLSEGTARAYIGQILDSLEKAGEAS
jgi:hypothetical protein